MLGFQEQMQKTPLFDFYCIQSDFFLNDPHPNRLSLSGNLWLYRSCTFPSWSWTLPMGTNYNLLYPPLRMDVMNASNRPPPHHSSYDRLFSKTGRELRPHPTQQGITADEIALSFTKIMYMTPRPGRWAEHLQKSKATNTDDENDYSKFLLDSKAHPSFLALGTLNTTSRPSITFQTVNICTTASQQARRRLTMPTGTKISRWPASKLRTSRLAHRTEALFPSPQKLHSLRTILWLPSSSTEPPHQ